VPDVEWAVMDMKDEFVLKQLHRQIGLLCSPSISSLHYALHSVRTSVCHFRDCNATREVAERVDVSARMTNVTVRVTISAV